MAGDWIKMRVSIARDPKVITMADRLGRQAGFASWAFGRDATECVTRNVTVPVTVAALLQLWGIANETGKADGDDVLVEHADIRTIDQIVGVPGFGEAMAGVRWVTQEQSEDGTPRLRFPKFLVLNTPADDRMRKANAERQKRYRQKKTMADSNSAIGNNATHSADSNVTRDVTRDVTVTPREEKRREEENTPPNPLPGEREPEGFAEFWAAYPRKTNKQAAIRAWKKLKPDPALRQRILAAIAVQKRSEQWQRDVITHASTWLNGRRWEDELPGTGPPVPAEDLAEKVARQRAEADRRTGLPRQGKVTGSELFGRNGHGTEF